MVARAGGEEAVAAGKDELLEDQITAWARGQAATAPPWSQAKRRQIAILLGLTLPNRDDSEETG